MARRVFHGVKTDGLRPLSDVHATPAAGRRERRRKRARAVAATARNGPLDRHMLVLVNAAHMYDPIKASKQSYAYAT